MKNEIPLKSAQWWEEPPAEPETTDRTSAVLFWASAALVSLPIAMTFSAWNDDSTVNYEISQLMQTIQMAVGW